MAPKKPKPPPRKRPRRAQDRPATSKSAHPSLTSLPIEILAEILICTRSPATVLAVSRTCSFLHRSLALNPAASFIWRSVRETCEPLPLPEPCLKEFGWRMNEAKYAALVFGDGACEVCGTNTRELYMSFAARIRLCSNWHCRRKFRDEHLVPANWMPTEEDRKHVWVPYVECNACFRTSVIDWSWPERNRALLFRKTDLERFRLELARYNSAKEAVAMHDLVSSPSIPSEEILDIIKRCNADMKRMPLIMELSVMLTGWKYFFDQARKKVKRENKLWTKDLAEREGWNFEDLVASQIYGSMQRRKNYLVEQITLHDVTPIRSTIESELLAMQARQQHQKSEASHRDNMTELKKIYERMRCDATEDSILPSLGVFFTLPSVRLLKGSPDPSAAPPSDIKSSPLATSLVKSDIHTWLIPVEKHLMGVLGYPNGWQSASTRTLPPLKRVTARFFCRRCGEGKVGKGYRREGCLNFKGVCSHICVTKQGKRIERDEGPEEGATDTETGAESGPEKRKRRKKSARTLDWKVELFEKDEKAIGLIRTVLGLTGLSEEDPCTVSKLQGMGTTIRCVTCTGWVVMDFETAIGHAHRHEAMQLQLSSVFSPSYVMPLNIVTMPPPANSRLDFERGNVELLLGRSRRARHLSKKDNYGCRHCIVACINQWTVDMTGKRMRRMSFNGLRSHGKEKHGISDIRDEDFFCFTCIQDDDQAFLQE